MKIRLIIILLPLIFTELLAQKQGNVWYFGNNAGIDFNTLPPIALTDGSLATEEGCATICDEDGVLKFYTDGVSVWNREHDLMPNGTGLNGNSSSTQSGVIVPKPGFPEIYYIFYVSDKTEAKGFGYSLVDMSLDGGLGDIYEKNIKLADSTVEKITAVKHENFKDIWVIMHGWKDSSFFSYLITEDGINSVENSVPGFPVESKTGSVHSDTVFDGGYYNKIGYLKASTSGRKLALAIYHGNTFEIFDFDSETGIVSNPLTFVDEKYRGAYGVEFSPNETKLYLTALKAKITPADVTRTLLYQFDISYHDYDSVMSSETVIAYVPGRMNEFGALQIAPDEKIYLARSDEKFLGVINSPNLEGSLCDYTEKGFDLAGQKCILGLPTFTQSFFYVYIRASVDLPVCSGDDIFLSCFDRNNSTYTWTGPNGFSSTEKNPVIDNADVSYSGYYYVTAKVAGFIRYDSVYVTVHQGPGLDLGDDISVCKGEAVSIGATAIGGTEPYEYSWETVDGPYDTEASFTEINPEKSNVYYLTVLDANGCSTTDSINVYVFEGPELLMEDTLNLCKGSNITIGSEPVSGDAPFEYKWEPAGSLNRNDIARPIANPEQNTMYYVTVTDNNGCEYRDSTFVAVRELPLVELAGDLIICYGDSVDLEASVSGIGPLSIEWEADEPIKDSGSETIRVAPEKTTTYYISVENEFNCFAYDSVTVNVEDNIDVKIMGPANEVITGKIVTLPMILKTASGGEQSFSINYTAGLSFNKTILFPSGMNVGSISYDESLCYVQVTGRAEFIKSNETVVNLTFLPALGNSVCTDIRLDGFDWENNACDVWSLEGTALCLSNICYENGTRLLNPDAVMSITQLKGGLGSGDLVFNINLIEDGEINISLFDSYGRKAMNLFSGYKQAGEELIYIDPDRLSSGLYFITVTTPTIIKTKKIIVF